MQAINVGLTTSISDFKKNPNAEVKRAGSRAFAVLTNNKPSFYVLTPALFDRFAELMWEEEIAPLVIERSAERDVAVAVDVADL